MKAINYHTNNKKHKLTQFSQFEYLFPIMTDECQKECMERLKEAERPSCLCNKDVPDNLNLITFGQYSDLCDVMTEKDADTTKIFYEFARILLDIPASELGKSSVFDVFGFGTWVCKEVEKITKMFNSIKVEHSSEEIQAGVKRLQFGTFGILDWYARRMGITDQNVINDIPWIRIYTCLKNDTDESAYQRRLHKIYNDKINKKK